MPSYDRALKRVLEAAGGPTRLAERLGVVPSAVTQWTRVPARHLFRIQALTGIPMHEIRPDLNKPAKPKARKGKRRTPSASAPPAPVPLAAAE